MAFVGVHVPGEHHVGEERGHRVKKKPANVIAGFEVLFSF